MDIHTVEIGKHTVRFANDSAPGEPDAWKYKVDHGMWSPPFERYGQMMDAAYADATADWRPGRWTTYHPSLKTNRRAS